MEKHKHEWVALNTNTVRCVVCSEERPIGQMYTEEEIQETTNEFEEQMKEFSHWVGGWNELRKVIDRLEEEEEERKWEEYGDRQYEGDGNFADNH